MSSRNIFSAFLGSRKYTVRHRDCDGQVHFETRQDCAPIVEFVKARRDAPVDRAWTHLAEVPMAVVGQWMRDGGLDDEAHVRRWINDPANRAFRVYEGRV